MGENQEVELIEEESESSTEELRIAMPLLFEEGYMAGLINTPEFEEGQKIGNKIGGIFTQLMNYGIGEDSALAILVNYMTAENNVEVQKINLEIAKVNSSNTEKNNF